MRYANWTKLLSETICKYSNAKFEYGKLDCCLFVCDCCVSICGVDPAINHRGRYTTELGAKKALIKYGGIEESFDKCFNSVPVNFAQRGDVCLYENNGGLTVAVMYNGWMGMAENGCVKVKPDSILKVWRVE